MIEQITLDNGKYKWILHDNYSSEVLRHGEKWRDTTGDNFVFAMAQKIANLEEELQKVYEEIGCD